MKCSKCGAKASGAGFCKSCGAPVVGFSMDQSAGRHPGAAESPANLQYAGFWRRFGAAVIDMFVIGVPVAVATSFLSIYQQTWPAFLKLHPGETPADLTAAFGHSFLVDILGFFILFSWIYYAGMESSGWQATLGKRMLLLRVTDKNGERISFWRATLRFAGGRLLANVPLCGAIYFMADCVCAGFTGLKQAIHDMMAGCLVIRSEEF
jgi:uncharacterized RDD family membrane protein YckC